MTPGFRKAQDRNLHLLKICVGILGVLCALAYLRQVMMVHSFAIRCCNEGWNTWHAADAMAGRPLYPDAGSLLPNNYPPLSFYIVGILGRLIGDNIVAGRAASLLTFLSIILAFVGT